MDFKSNSIICKYLKGARRNWEKIQKIFYNIGLDIGTNSIGYAVTDMDGKLIKIKNKNFGVLGYLTKENCSRKKTPPIIKRKKQRKNSHILLQQILKMRLEKQMKTLD